MLVREGDDCTSYRRKRLCSTCRGVCCCGSGEDSLVSAATNLGHWEGEGLLVARRVFGRRGHAQGGWGASRGRD